MTSVCPCSKAISDRGAHNQRGWVTIESAPATPTGEVWFDDLIAIAESAGSSPVYALLKRPDERYVTMAGYDNPVFVEDMARNVALALRQDHADRRVHGAAWSTTKASITTPPTPNIAMDRCATGAAEHGAWLMAIRRSRHGAHRRHLRQPQALPRSAQLRLRDLRSVGQVRGSPRGRGGLSRGHRCGTGDRPVRRGALAGRARSSAASWGTRRRLWVCSAGYGLIPCRRPLHPYAATFASGSPDSVGDTVARCGRGGAG